MSGPVLDAQDGPRAPRPLPVRQAGHSLLQGTGTRGVIQRVAQSDAETIPQLTIPSAGQAFYPPVTTSMGQESVQPTVRDLSEPATLPVNSHRWSFNFQEAPWLAVLRAYAREFNFSLQISASTEGAFSYYNEQPLTSTETLDIFNDALLATGRILIRDEQRITLVDATATIPGNLIPFVSIQQIEMLGRNELATVAIPLKGPDPEQMLEELTGLQSALGQVRMLSSANRVVLTDTGSYLRRMRDLLLGSGLAAADQQSHVYQLKHAKAEDVAKAIADFLSAGGGAAAATDGSIPLSGGASGGQRVVAEKTTNSLLVRGTSEELATIQRLIAELDRSPREVMVQALLVEVELGDVNELGLELGFQDSVLFDRSVVDKLVTINQTNTSPNGTQTTNQAIISQTAVPGFNFNGQPLGNNTAANPSRIGGQALSNFGVSRVNGDLGFGGLVLSAGSESVNVLLRALDANFNIEVLSRPVVRSLENKEALVQVGQQVPIVDGVTLTPVGSANPSIRQDKAGIILKVTPRISPDARVQLDVQAEKSAFNLTPGSGVPIFTDATNGNVIEAPIKDLTTAQTTVSIQSGHTVVLGGMITNDQTVVVRKLPWLGDIPVIGRLFRYDFNRLKRKELLVFLTPVVIENDDHAESLKYNEISKVRLPAEAWNLQDGLGVPADGTAGWSSTDGSGDVPESGVETEIAPEPAPAPLPQEPVPPIPAVQESRRPVGARPVSMATSPTASYPGHSLAGQISDDESIPDMSDSEPPSAASARNRGTARTTVRSAGMSRAGAPSEVHAIPYTTSPELPPVESPPARGTVKKSTRLEQPSGQAAGTQSSDDGFFSRLWSRPAAPSFMKLGTRSSETAARKRAAAASTAVKAAGNAR
jgi:type II secretory pathway component GspD/PulD (secretin)